LINYLEIGGAQYQVKSSPQPTLSFRPLGLEVIVKVEVRELKNITVPKTHTKAEEIFCLEGNTTRLNPAARECFHPKTCSVSQPLFDQSQLNAWLWNTINNTHYPPTTNHPNRAVFSLGNP